MLLHSHLVFQILPTPPFRSRVFGVRHGGGFLPSASALVIKPRPDLKPHETMLVVTYEGGIAEYSYSLGTKKFAGNMTNSGIGLKDGFLGTSQFTQPTSISIIEKQGKS